MKEGLMMRYCQLYTGQQMPVLGMGFYQVPVLETSKVASQAIEMGYRLFDTAYYYGNEQGVGQAVRQSGLPRQDFFITSKVNSSGYLATKQAIKQALDKMQLDYLDLMLIHWMVPDYMGTYRAMEEAVSKGYVRAIGLSNFGRKEIETVLSACRVRPAVLQSECHLFHQQGIMRAYTQQVGIQFEGWAPFAEGRREIFQHPAVAAMARRYGKSVAQVLLAFLMQEGVIVIPRTVNPSQMKENFDSLDLTLSPDDLAILRSFDEGRNLIWQENIV
jgi:hypothetical protein